MKISIHILDEKNNRFMDIPLTVREIREVYDYTLLAMFYRLGNEKVIHSLDKKIEHIVNDIIDDGIIYRFSSSGRLKKEKKKHYMVKKPKWTKLFSDDVFK